MPDATSTHIDTRDFLIADDECCSRPWVFYPSNADFYWGGISAPIEKVVLGPEMRDFSKPDFEL